MTKEQEEAIEIIDKMIKSYIEADECGLSNNDFKYEIEAMQTVLNMLKEKDKEIEKLKKHNKELLRKLRNRVKEVKKLEKYSLYKKEFKTLNKQLKNKDKIIDLMAEKIFREGIVWDDKEEVKQYFKSKVEKEQI